MVLDSVFKILDMLSTTVAEFLKVLSCLCLVGLIFTFAYLVYGRYVLNDTPTWVEQSSMLFIIFISFVSAAIGIRENTHISVNFIAESFSENIQIVLRLLTNIILLVFGLFLMDVGYDLYLFYLDIEIPILDIPQSVSTVPVMMNGGALVLFTLTNIVKFIIHLTSNRTTNQ